MANGFLENLFQGEPQTVFDKYAQTANALDTLRKQRIANALSQIKLNAAPTLTQQAIDTGAANTSFAQNRAKFAPQISSATLSGLNLENQGRQLQNAMSSEKFKYLPQQLQQGIALKAAQIDFLKQKAALLPQQLANQTKKTDWYTSPQYNAPRYIGLQKGAARDAFIANNQQMVNDLTRNTLSQANQQIASQGVNPVLNNNSQSLPMGSGIVPPGASDGSPQSSIDQQQLANQIAANKSSVQPYTSKRLDNTIQVEKFLQDPMYSQILPDSAAEYSGIKGKGKEFIAKWMNDNSTKFGNNIQFKNKVTSDIVNLNRNLEALSVQKSQREELIGNLREAFDQWSSNPERAMDQYARTMAEIHDIAASNSEAAQPIYKGVREKAAGLNAPTGGNLQSYIQNHRPGYVYVRDKSGNSGYIKADEWLNANTSEKSKYQRIG